MKSFVLASIITASLVVSVGAMVINVGSGDDSAQAGSEISARPSALLTGNWILLLEIIAGFLDGEFIDMPDELKGDIIVAGVFDEGGAFQPAGNGGIAMSVEGDPPFVNVSGFGQVDGSFFLTGIGTVAGFPNVTVEFEGTIEFPGILNGEYSMGVAGELPEGITVYQVTGTKETQVTQAPTATPDVTATPTPGPTGTPSPGFTVRWGDSDCDNDNDTIDVLKSIQYLAGIGFTQNEPCPGLGDSVSVAAGAEERLWGDVDCDGDVDSVDALMGLRDIAGLTVTQEAGCPLIGSEVTIEI